MVAKKDQFKIQNSEKREKKEEEVIKSFIKGGNVVLRVTSSVIYTYPIGSVNNWTTDEVIKDWFNEEMVNISHATRDSYEVGNSKRIRNIEVFEPNQKLPSGTYKIDTIAKPPSEAEAETKSEKEESLNVEFSIYCGYQESEIILNKIIKMLNENLEGYTILHSTGFWMGESEKSLKIVILGKDSDREKIRQICEKINYIANQQTTLLTYDTIEDMELINTRLTKIEIIKKKI